MKVGFVGGYKTNMATRYTKGYPKLTGIGLPWAGLCSMHFCSWAFFSFSVNLLPPVSSS